VKAEAEPTSDPGESRGDRAVLAPKARWGPIDRPEPPSRPRSLVATLLTIDAVVLATAGAVLLAWRIRHVIFLFSVALFVAVVLEPVVQFLRRRGFPRGWAVVVVLLCGLTVFGLLAYLFVPPVVRAGTDFAHTLPSLVSKAEHGHGALGKFIRDHHWVKYVRSASKKIAHYFSSFNLLGSVGQSALSLARSTLSVVVSVLAIVVLALFILLEAPRIVNGLLSVLSKERADRILRIADEAFSSVTGYVMGKLVTSALFAAVIFGALAATGTSYPIVLAIWVGLADLLPMVGGLLAAIVVVPVALAHSVTAGVVTLVVFLVYQQVENHLLSPVIMRKTMSLNPLLTLLAVLAGADLLGIVGALIAIPLAGVVQVVAREVWKDRRQRVIDWGSGTDRTAREGGRTSREGGSTPGSIVEGPDSPGGTEANSPTR